MSVITYPNVTGIAPLNAPTVTYATLLTLSAASFARQTMYVSDMGLGCMFYSDGTNWKPLDRWILLAELVNPFTTAASSTEQVITYGTIPIGTPTGAAFRWRLSGQKSAVAETCIIRARIGTAHAITDTDLNMGSASMATTNDAQCFYGEVKRVSATSVVGLGVRATTSGLGTSASDMVTTTVTNMDSSQTYISLTSAVNVGAETVTWNGARIDLLWPT